MTIKVVMVLEGETDKPLHKVELVEGASFEHQMTAFLDATRLVLTHAAQGRSTKLCIEARKGSIN